MEMPFYNICIALIASDGDTKSVIVASHKTSTETTISTDHVQLMQKKIEIQAGKVGIQAE